MLITEEDFHPRCVVMPSRGCPHQEIAREEYDGMIAIARRCIHQGCNSKIIEYHKKDSINGEPVLRLQGSSRFFNGEIVERKRNEN